MANCACCFAADGPEESAAADTNMRPSVARRASDASGSRPPGRDGAFSSNRAQGYFTGAAALTHLRTGASPPGLCVEQVPVASGTSFR
jgi:hypothetical protein